MRGCLFNNRVLLCVCLVAGFTHGQSVKQKPESGAKRSSKNGILFAAAQQALAEKDCESATEKLNEVQGEDRRRAEWFWFSTKAAECAEEYEKAIHWATSYEEVAGSTAESRSLLGHLELLRTRQARKLSQEKAKEEQKKEEDARDLRKQAERAREVAQARRRYEDCERSRKRCIEKCTDRKRAEAVSRCQAGCYFMARTFPYNNPNPQICAASCPGDFYEIDCDNDRECRECREPTSD